MASSMVPRILSKQEAALSASVHGGPIGKLRKRGIDEWTVRRIGNWMDGRAQRVVISGTV